MLAAAHRLRRSDEFAAAIRGGRRAGRETVVVHLAVPDQTGTDQPPADEQSLVSRAVTPDLDTKPARTAGALGPPVRAGFVVSKAVGGAVTRNKVRRRLRHLVAERLDRLPPGTILVVRALPAAAAAPYGRLGVDLDEAIAAARAPRPARQPRTARRRG